MTVQMRFSMIPATSPEGGGSPTKSLFKTSPEGGGSPTKSLLEQMEHARLTVLRDRPPPASLPQHTWRSKPPAKRTAYQGAESYAAACKLKVRSGAELDSDEAGELPASAIVTVLEHRQLPDGTTRALVATYGETEPLGWVSCMGREKGANLVPFHWTRFQRNHRSASAASVATSPTPSLQGRHSPSSAEAPRADSPPPPVQFTDSAAAAKPRAISPSSSLLWRGPIFRGSQTATPGTGMAQPEAATPEPSIKAAVTAMSFVGKLSKKTAEKSEKSFKTQTSAELQAAVDALVAKQDAEKSKVSEVSKVTSMKLAVGEALVKSNTKVSELVKSWATNSKGVVGEINKMDFRKHLRKVVDWQNVKDIDNFFAEVDEDGGGLLDAPELTVAVKKLQDEARGKEARIRAAEQNVAWFEPRIAVARAAFDATLRAETNTERLEFLSTNKGLSTIFGAQLLKRGTKIGDLVKSWDNTDGEMNKKQFRKNLTKFGIEADDATMDGLFDELDVDGGGSLDSEELKAALAKMRETSQESDKELVQLKKGAIEIWKTAKAAQAEAKKQVKADEEAARQLAEVQAQEVLRREEEAHELEAKKKSKQEAARKRKEEEEAAYEAKIRERRAQQNQQNQKA